MPEDPTAMRRAALKADIERAGELVSLCIADALALGVVVPHTVHDAVAELGRWARHLVHRPGR